MRLWRRRRRAVGVMCLWRPDKVSLGGPRAAPTGARARRPPWVRTLGEKRGWARRWRPRRLSPPNQLLAPRLAAGVGRAARERPPLAGPQGPPPLLGNDERHAVFWWPPVHTVETTARRTRSVVRPRRLRQHGGGEPVVAAIVPPAIDVLFNFEEADASTAWRKDHSVALRHCSGSHGLLQMRAGETSARRTTGGAASSTIGPWT
ncbi:hypothetical protein BU14_0094s0010 [Porphyra umbilicalis]|uniref:Uncharacterized protein n=1 Tax=Porphyra umbilicalis TaxID=2786 RepID=A0A1X6PE66_PORUM|nr:hypothetical protein BU14_0094s0010 [Porphyra umbilicalis]|eukprot:OSX78933.1 hypothetical protein BU14_0094s0010 [Porphyra umbilicalis]